MDVREGFEVVTIRSGGPDGLQATFAPRAGMVCCSLRHRGAELLAQRGGLRAYAERGSTMGIPLLYPWANRLAGFGYEGPNGPVELPRSSPLLKLDGHGLPIHGVMPGALAWELSPPGTEGDAPAAGVHARLEWDTPELLAIFPFTHRLELRARVDASTLLIEATLTANGGMTVPVSFGFHPYLTLPGSARETWKVELPVTRRLLLDAQMIPTGASEPFERTRFELAGSSWDDAFAGLRSPTVFAVDDGERRLELEFVRGFPFAQVYAPAREDFICFEPMSAPTNALLSGDALPLLDAGHERRAAFRVSVAV